jgi:hypothetical protein
LKDDRERECVRIPLILGILFIRYGSRLRIF